ncbi:MAG: MaoC/PaaZ C-terminal domain-containing protein [Ferrovibrio sp.]
MISIEHTLTQQDFNAFATVSGDNNPIHVDPDFSARTRFGRTVSHGMLLYTVLWGMVQKHYPGARQVSQTLMFPNPSYAGEAHRFSLTEIAAADGRHTLATQVVRIADGAIVLDGQTEIARS